MNGIRKANVRSAERGAFQTLPVQIIRHEVIAPNVVTLSLAQPGTWQAPGPYRPGQFITLVFPGNNGTIYRSYSLCGDGHPLRPWEITVKCLPGGLVSDYLHHGVNVGTILHTLPPRGSFILPSPLRPEQTFVFVAMGSGITPIRGFLRAIAALPPGSRPQVQLHYASRSWQEIIYRDEMFGLHWLPQRHYLRTEGPRVTPQQIFANAYPLSSDAQWYICGPQAFTFQLKQALILIGVPENLVHVEIFADQSRKQPTAVSHAVVGHISIEETGETIDVREQETVLEALERHGYQPEFGCRSGSCGTCQLRVFHGHVRNPGTNSLTASSLRSDTILACMARPQGHITIESGGSPPRDAAVRGRPVTKKRTAQKYRLRLAAAVVLGLLTLGLWHLTDHNVSVVSSGSPSTSIPATPTTNTVTATPAGTPASAASVTPTPTQAPIATPTPATKTSSS